MNFEEFCAEIVASISNYLPQYDIEHITTEKISKNNGIQFTGVAILLKGEAVAPSIYLDYYYMLYRQGRNLDDVLSMISAEYVRARNIITNASFNVNKEGLESSVFLKVVSYEKNKAMLDKCPYIRLHDLAICFRYMVHIDEGGVASAILSNSDLEKWDITMEELYDMALPNTRKLFPPIIKSMDDVIPDLERLVEDDSEIKKIYILTNEAGVNGATCILFTDVIREFAESHGSSVCIIPSSIHELVLLCAKKEEKAHLGDLVKQINKYIVTEVEYLSDNVFFYDLDEDKITI